MALKGLHSINSLLSLYHKYLLGKISFPSVCHDLMVPCVNRLNRVNGSSPAIHSISHLNSNPLA